MDPFTHGLVGAAVGQMVAPPDRRRESAFAGLVAAMLADLDVLLTRDSDPLFQLELHRQFSHSLLFVPVGALVATGLLWWFLKRRLNFSRLYLACFAGYWTAGLLDACTSYGTQLLWPFSSARLAANVIAVVDPIFTLGLLTLLLLSFKKGPGWRKLPLLWIGTLLLYGALQQQRALAAAREVQLSRGHHPTSTVVKPTLGNQLLWRVCYIFENRVYADGVRANLLSSPTIYPGESAPLLRVEHDYAALEGTSSYTDLQRFAQLSAGYLILHPERPNVVGDARYAMLPTSLRPLWGVELAAEPGEPVTFLTFRDSSKDVREALLTMLLGR